MKNKFKLISALFVIMLLITLVGCTGQKNDVWADATYTSDTVLGEGVKSITVVVKADDRSLTFTLKTDADNLGAALLETKLAEGEDGPYGLYIKKVNGILGDYDVDKHYWSVEKDGTALMTGADGEKIQGGETYEVIRAR